MSTMLALLRRDWEIERTYQLRMILVFVDTALLAVGLYFIGLLIEDPASLADYGGNYFDFALVGLVVTSFAGVGLAAFGESLGREQSTGTIDLLLSSPASVPTLMAGMFLFPFLLAVVQIAGLLAFGMGVAGSGVPLGGLLLAIPILLLTTATFGAVGIGAAGIMLLAKRGDPISGPFYQASMLLSGVIVPIEVLPGFLRAISVVLPATWGVRAVRELLLADAGWRDVVPEFVVLVGFTVVLLPLSVGLFRYCLRTAKAEGILGSY